MEIENYNPYLSTISFYEYFNELNGTGKNSYFKDPDLAIEPLNDDEAKQLFEFKQMLENYNSSIVFESIIKAIWKNIPYVFISKEQIHSDVIDELLLRKFDITLNKTGVYFCFSNKASNCARSRFDIVGMFDRAFTTRVLMSSIFHEIFSKITLEIDLKIDAEIEYSPVSKYINLQTVANIVSKVTNLNTMILDGVLHININNLTVNAPQIFHDIANYSDLMDGYFEQLLQAATERKLYTNISCFDVNVQTALMRSLNNAGFHCEKVGSLIDVDWSDGVKLHESSFARVCWVRYNTINYYRACAATITRALKHDPDYMAIILPAPTKPIDEKYFLKHFNEHQSFRCDPIQVSEDRERKYMTYVKPEYSEKIKEQLKARK